MHLDICVRANAPFQLSKRMVGCGLCMKRPPSCRTGTPGSSGSCTRPAPNPPAVSTIIRYTEFWMPRHHRCSSPSAVSFASTAVPVRPGDNSSWAEGVDSCRRAWSDVRTYSHARGCKPSSQALPFRLHQFPSTLRLVHNSCYLLLLVRIMLVSHIHALIRGGATGDIHKQCLRSRKQQCTWRQRYWLVVYTYRVKISIHPSTSRQLRANMSEIIRTFW